MRSALRYAYRGAVKTSCEKAKTTPHEGDGRPPRARISNPTPPALARPVPVHLRRESNAVSIPRAASSPSPPLLPARPVPRSGVAARPSCALAFRTSRCPSHPVAGGAPACPHRLSPRPFPSALGPVNTRLVGASDRRAPTLRPKPPGLSRDIDRYSLYYSRDSVVLPGPCHVARISILVPVCSQLPRSAGMQQQKSSSGLELGGPSQVGQDRQGLRSSLRLHANASKCLPAHRPGGHRRGVPVARAPHMTRGLFCNCNDARPRHGASSDMEPQSP